MGVVERERGELADRPDELDLLGRVRALLLVVEELDHADDPVAHLERHAELAGLAVLAQQAALVVVQAPGRRALMIATGRPVSTTRAVVG